MKGQLISVALFIFLALSCNNKKAENKGTTDDKKISTSEKAPDRSDLHNIISFTVDGSAVTTSGWNISRFNFGNGAGTSLNVTSNMHLEPRTINININGDKPGVYSLQSGLGTVKTPGIAYGSYNPDYMKQMGNHYSFRDGEFTITSIDTIAGSLNAKFYGTAKNEKGETVTITDGLIIDGKLKPGITRLGN